MNRFKGTPAPWGVDGNGYFFDIVELRSGSFIGNTCSSTNCYDEGEYKEDGVAYANACLMALAPELLEVLIEIVEMQSKNYGNGMNTHMQLANIAKKAKIVIAKALGETK